MKVNVHWGRITLKYSHLNITYIILAISHLFTASVKKVVSDGH